MPMNRSLLFRFLMVPLGLVLGLWAGWAWLNAPGEETDLFAQYFRVEPIRDLDTGPLPYWRKAAQAYRTGDYVAANTAFREAEQAKEVPEIITRFYQGQCLLATGFSDEAIGVYRGLLAQPKGPHAAMRWYLTLAYLHAGKLALARENLSDLASGSGYYAGTAAQLLEQLDNGAR